MDWQQDKHSTAPEQGSSSELAHAPTAKPRMDWEQPDFEEFDLCMEVTTYIQHWQ